MIGILSFLNGWQNSSVKLFKPGRFSVERLLIFGKSTAIHFEILICYIWNWIFQGVCLWCLCCSIYWHEIVYNMCSVLLMPLGSMEVFPLSLLIWIICVFLTCLFTDLPILLIFKIIAFDLSFVLLNYFNVSSSFILIFILCFLMLSLLYFLAPKVEIQTIDF